MGIFTMNDRPGWSREVTEYDDGTRYICDSTICDSSRTNGIGGYTFIPKI